MSALSQVLIRTNSQGKHTFHVYDLDMIEQEDTDGHKNYHYESVIWSL